MSFIDSKSQIDLHAIQKSAVFILMNKLRRKELFAFFALQILQSCHCVRKQVQLFLSAAREISENHNFNVFYIEILMAFLYSF